MPTFHRFDAEMAELVEERDVTNSIKEKQWSFLMDLQENGNWSCPPKAIRSLFLMSVRCDRR